MYYSNVIVTLSNFIYTLIFLYKCIGNITNQSNRIFII